MLILLIKIGVIGALVLCNNVELIFEKRFLELGELVPGGVGKRLKEVGWEGMSTNSMAMSGATQ